MTDWEDESTEEESSFITMADMMVGLLLVFIILLTYYVLTSQQAINAAERVSKTEQAAVVTRGIVLNRIRDRIDDDRIEFDATTGTIRFSENVLTFKSGDYEIPERARPSLLDMAEAMAEALPCLSYLDDIEQTLDCSWLQEDFLDQNWFDRNLGSLQEFRPPEQPPLIWIDGVFVEGHTDCQPVRGKGDFGNWELGAQRAAQTYLLMTAQNPQLGRIFSKDPFNPETMAGAHRILGVASYADRRPARDFGKRTYPADPRLSSNFTEACQDLVRNEVARDGKSPPPQNTRNRRIDIRIVMGWTTQAEQR